MNEQPDNSAPSEDPRPPATEADNPLGQEPAVNLMRARLSGVYPTAKATSPSESPPPITEPVDLNPHGASVHGQVEPDRADNKTTDDVKRELLSRVRRGGDSRRSRLKPFLFALAAGLVYLAVSYNEIAIAQVRQYLSPGSGLTTPVIVDPTVDVKVGQEPRLIIPKINVDVPVVYDIRTYNEQAIQSGLERGVVHYGNTAVPGEKGNNVIVGHSSNNFFNTGRYKFAFVLLGKLEVGDTFILNYNGQRYIYKVKIERIIEPNDFSLIQPTNTPSATLITCTPPGTSWHRLVIRGEQISPDPDQAKSVASHVVEDLDAVDTVVPGNAPSFWSRIFDWFD